MEPYGKLYEENTLPATPTHEQPPQGIYLQVQKPTTYQIPERVFKILGSIQIVIGVLSIMFGILGLVLNPDHITLVGYGIWCGILFSLSGCFAVVAAIKKTLCFIITCMVLSTVVAACSMITLGFGGAEFGIGLDERHYPRQYYHHHWLNWKLAVATGIFLIIGSITEAVVAITCAGITCAKTCCSPATYQLVQTNPTVQYIPGQQQVIYIGAPPATPK